MKRDKTLVYPYLIFFLSRRIIPKTPIKRCTRDLLKKPVSHHGILYLIQILKRNSQQVSSLGTKILWKFHHKNVKHTAKTFIVLFRSRVRFFASWIKLINFFVNKPAKNILNSLFKISIAIGKLDIKLFFQTHNMH